jgi:hypothetical protein
MALYTDITVDQGSTYSGRIPVVGANGLPVNLTGYFVRGQIRRSYSSLTSIAFTCSIEDPLTGVVFINLSPQQTALIKPGRYVFDVEIYNADESDVIRISEGQVDVTPRVIRTATNNNTP